jgi:hypothetical protein
VGEAGADGEAITVIRIAEAEIGADLSGRLQSLLQACFPGYPSRSYFKLPPHFRYLAMTSGGGVVAQMGVEFRVVRAGDTVVRTFGVVDLCVQESQRSRGWAICSDTGECPHRMTRDVGRVPAILTKGTALARSSAE